MGWLPFSVLGAGVVAGFIGWRRYRLRRRMALDMEVTRFLENPSSREALCRSLRPGDEPLLLEILLVRVSSFKNEFKVPIGALAHERGWLDRELLRLSSALPWRRVRAARYLGLIGDRRACESLERALEDHVYAVRREAALALMTCDPERLERVFPALFSDQWVWTDTQLRALVASLGRNASPLLRAAVENGNGRARRLAVELLGMFADSTALETLLLWSRKGDPEISPLAEAALRRMP